MLCPQIWASSHFTADTLHGESNTSWLDCNQVLHFMSTLHYKKDAWCNGSPTQQKKHSLVNDTSQMAAACCLDDLVQQKPGLHHGHPPAPAALQGPEVAVQIAQVERHQRGHVHRHSCRPAMTTHRQIVKSQRECLAT